MKPRPHAISVCHALPAVRRAFTLVEMLTVVIIVGLILVMALPAFSRMWEERKLAGAITTLHGVLTSTRAKALRGSERGLFFYIDTGTGRQMIIPIVSDPPNPDPDSQEYWTDCRLRPPVPITQCISDLMAQDRFRTVEGDTYELSVPIRIAPRDLVESGVWAEEDIAWDWFNKSRTADTRPRHRNFFTILFGPDGKRVTGRSVLIHDIALTHPATGNKFPTGRRTGLTVGEATEYYPISGPMAKLDPDGRKLYDLIVEVGGVGGGDSRKPNALNFPSADGLLVYDESVLKEISFESGKEFKRQYLLDNGRPIYVSPQTGEVLEGPKGENQ